MFPGRIPHELWRIAAAAARVHGVDLTAARLQVDVARLKRWLGVLGEAGGAAAPVSPPAFVELPPLDIGAAGECMLEIEEPSGRKLRMVWKGPATTQAMELGQRLWRSGP
jgi:hypothetical protein